MRTPAPAPDSEALLAHAPPRPAALVSGCVRMASGLAGVAWWTMLGLCGVLLLLTWLASDDWSVRLAAPLGIALGFSPVLVPLLWLKWRARAVIHAVGRDGALVDAEIKGVHRIALRGAYVTRLLLSFRDASGAGQSAAVDLPGQPPAVPGQRARGLFDPAHPRAMLLAWPGAGLTFGRVLTQVEASPARRARRITIGVVVGCAWLAGLIVLATRCPGGG